MIIIDGESCIIEPSKASLHVEVGLPSSQNKDILCDTWCVECVETRTRCLYPSTSIQRQYLSLEGCNAVRRLDESVRPPDHKIASAREANLDDLASGYYIMRQSCIAQ